MDTWHALRLELEREAEAIFASSGEIVLVTLDRESDSILMLISRTKSLQLTWTPERNAVRWDRPHEYGFEKIPGEMALLAHSLMQRVRQ